MENKLVTISVMALHEKFGEKLTHCTIKKSIEDGETFYDLYTGGWHLACCDGEECEITHVENGVYTLANYEGELSEEKFKLTQDELNIACFN